MQSNLKILEIKLQAKYWISITDSNSSVVYIITVWSVTVKFCVQIGIYQQWIASSYESK